MCCDMIVVALFLLQAVCMGLPTFEKDLTFQGQTCSPVSQYFGETYSRVYCAILCESDTTCYGFFHSSTYRSCFGVSYVLTLPAACSTNTTFQFYRKLALPPVYGSTCTMHSDCNLANAECWASTCKCAPGYKHDPGASACVSVCTTYGSDFAKYTDYGLLVTSLTDYSGITQPQCETNCVNLATCRSYNYAVNMGPLCTLKGVTAVDSPGDWSIYGGIDHYVRNCA